MSGEGAPLEDGGDTQATVVVAESRSKKTLGTYLEDVGSVAFCAALRSPKSMSTSTNATTELEEATSPMLFPSPLSEELAPPRDIDVRRLIERDVSMERLDELCDGDASTSSSSSSTLSEPLVSKTMSAIGDTVRGALRSTREYVHDVVDARGDDDNVPKYPIVRYMVLGADAPTEEAPLRRQSYEDALALSVFVSEFVAMLQHGFRLVKHVPRQPSRLHTLVLSTDCSVLSWTPVKTKPGERKVLTKRRVGDAAVVPDPQRPLARSRARAANCFALTFAPLAERQAGLAPREVHVFEPATRPTKHLLVDGFQLLVERAVHKFFASQEFRVARATKVPPKLGPNSAGRAAAHHKSRARASATAVPDPAAL